MMFGKKMILVLQRGWVKVGEVGPCHENSLFVTLNYGGNIRKWGTTAGLEQLAFEGPTSKTVIDVQSTEKMIPLFSIIHMMECSEKGWATWFASRSK